MNILNAWQEDYCAGNKIPVEIREEASCIFDRVYNNEQYDCKYKGEKIYRIMTLPQEGRIIRFDDLYYSFSSSLDGIKNVVISDKNLRNDVLLLLESVPIKAVDYNILMGSAHGDCKEESRFYKEHEVVSKLTISSLYRVIMYKEGVSDFEKGNGIEIPRKDWQLEVNDFIKKYHLS